MGSPVGYLTNNNNNNINNNNISFTRSITLGRNSNNELPDDRLELLGVPSYEIDGCIREPLLKGKAQYS
jgi:hypothetical protein